ncbi:hypothetical protein [Pseudomonas fragi]|uniref:hypothetical protein n=1 Tax=Pseudomonas fragi TaxID=296 RepID=UPI00193B3335|nr:hypothetical protein [Pseudomonas fragi]MBM1205896.1 hypothetical protein [Pseudomonas fragi]
MSLIGENTKWVLFLSAKNEPEIRHINDIAYGVLCLEKAGVSISDIAIYIDGSDRASIENFLKSGTSSQINIKESKDFFTDQTNNEHENIVMFVTGHGGPLGIDADEPISPHQLLNCLKSSPNLRHAVVYLGQCYAGIFNYIGAGSKVKNGQADPEIIFLGATNLHESLSLHTTEDFLTGPMSWLANIFLLFTFKWFSSPVDIDGDGKFTIMDSYKYAGVGSNSSNKNMKTNALINSSDLQAKFMAAKQAYDVAQTTMNEVAYKAAYTNYSTQASLLYIHQECWVLNAIPSQRMEAI